MTIGFAEFGYRLPRLFDPTALPIATRQGRGDLYAPDYRVPRQQVHAVPEAMQQLHELIRIAQWSNRVLADIIGSSHPTIAQALAGNASALSRSAVQRQRLNDAYAVVSRIHLLAGRDADRTASALDTPGTDDLTAIDHLSNAQMTKAYLAAARALRPSRRADMMIGSHPIDPRTATVAVLDEE